MTNARRPKERDPLKAIVRPFEIVRDEHGYAMAIAVDGFFLIHFHRGTTRNEENARKLLDVLNASAAYVHKECGVESLRRALERLMPNVKTMAPQ